MTTGRYVTNLQILLLTGHARSSSLRPGTLVPVSVGNQY